MAILLGSLVGLEREVAGQGAGLRTHALVALGASLYTVVSLAYSQPPLAGVLPPGDTVRIVTAIATGIGFLGAGAIVRSPGSVQGLTTAASLWTVAAIGLAAGSGFYALAAVSTLLVLIVLRVFEWLKGLLRLGPASDRE